MMAHKVIPLATTEQQFEADFEPFVTIESLYVEPPSSTASAVFTNNGTSGELPPDMQFNDGHRLAITVYSLLMFFSAAGNIYVLTSIAKLRRKGKLSRVSLFMLHLTIADLVVTFFMMPLEIAWSYTVSWEAGDLTCRIMSFLRIFGLYLSGFVLVVISLDLFFAVITPLGIAYANGRAKIMLWVAWISSLICSMPQPFIFHVESHPKFQWYEQCVTFNSFPSPKYELAYNLFSFFFLYVFPLSMIIFCYSCILCQVYRISTKKSGDKQLRRSNTDSISRAKIRTLKMTITFVATFCLCWTPYNIMSLWYWFDKKSALVVDQRIQKGLFLFACTNSCLNPIIYGIFHFRQNLQDTGVRMSTLQSRGHLSSKAKGLSPNILLNVCMASAFIFPIKNFLLTFNSNKNQTTVQQSERLNRYCKDVIRESPYKSTSQKANVDGPITQDAVVVVHSKGQCITSQADLTCSNGRFPIIIFQGQETQV